MSGAGSPSTDNVLAHFFVAPSAIAYGRYSVKMFFRSAKTARCFSEFSMKSVTQLTFGDADNDYETATVLSRRLEGWSQRRSENETAVMTNRAAAQRIADVWLEDAWRARQTAEFRLAPQAAAIEPGDVVTLPANGAANGLTCAWQITRIMEGPARECFARAVDPSIYDRAPPAYARRAREKPRTPGPAATSRNRWCRCAIKTAC